MPGPTEAELLFRTGRLYIRRAGWASQRGLLFAGIKHGGWSVYDADDPHLHFDLEGRWQRLLRDGVHYRKSWNGEVVAMNRERQNGALVLDRAALGGTPLEALDDWVREKLDEIAQRLLVPTTEFRPPPAPAQPLTVEEFQSLLAGAQRWTADARERDRQLWCQAYPIRLELPPDAGLALVLLPRQAGPESELSPADFEVHIRLVQELHGRRLAQARHVLLGGHDVLEAPTEMLFDWLETVQRMLPMRDWPAGQRPGEREPDEVALAGVEGLLRATSCLTRSAADWKRLVAAGLRRVTLIAENQEAHAKRFIPLLREAGIGVSLWLRLAQVKPEDRPILRNWADHFGLTRDDHLLVSSLADEGLIL